MQCGLLVDEKKKRNAPSIKGKFLTTNGVMEQRFDDLISLKFACVFYTVDINISLPGF